MCLKGKAKYIQILCCMGHHHYRVCCLSKGWWFVLNRRDLYQSKRKVGDEGSGRMNEMDSRKNVGSEREMESGRFGWTHTVAPPATGVHTRQLSVLHNGFNGHLSTITPVHVTHLPPTNTHALAGTWWLEENFHFVVQSVQYLVCVECVRLILCGMFCFSEQLFICLSVSLSAQYDLMSVRI